MTKKPSIIIAAGGTGGHMFPAQALAEEMIERGWQVRLSTDARGKRYASDFPKDVTIDTVRASTFSRGGLKGKIFAPILIFQGVIDALRSMRKQKPRVIVGFGGYPAVPALLAGGIKKIPRIIHEQNGILGRVNKLFSKKVCSVACGSWPTQLPKNVKAEYVGNPVRSKVLQYKNSPYTPPGNWPLSLLVIGGSQGSSIVSKTTAEAITLLPEYLRINLRVACQVRKEDMAAVEKIFLGSNVSFEIEEFFQDVPLRISQAQLVISRSGASSIADISIIGRPSILIPFAAATGDHQTANSQGLVKAGAANIISENKLTPEILAENITKILSSDEIASNMAKRALVVGKPNAVSELADLIEANAKDEL